VAGHEAARGDQMIAHRPILAQREGRVVEIPAIAGGLVIDGSCAQDGTRGYRLADALARR
jgi:hypothetical protein